MGHHIRRVQLRSRCGPPGHACSSPASRSAAPCARSVCSSGVNSRPSCARILSFLSSRHGWLVDPSAHAVGSASAHQCVPRVSVVCSVMYSYLYPVLAPPTPVAYGYAKRKPYMCVVSGIVGWCARDQRQTADRVVWRVARSRAPAKRPRRSRCSPRPQPQNAAGAGPSTRLVKSKK